jgi:hypothetical protein
MRKRYESPSECSGIALSQPKLRGIEVPSVALRSSRAAGWGMTIRCEQPSKMQLESQVAPLLISESFFELGARPAAGTTRVKKERQVQLSLSRNLGSFFHLVLVRHPARDGRHGRGISEK